MSTDCKLKFYQELAAEIKPLGFRCFLFHSQTSWMYIITPKNSLLLIDDNPYGGVNVVYEYEPSVEFGSGCPYNDESLGLLEVNADILLKAEAKGRKRGTRGWKEVPNTYNNGTHMEYVNKRPVLYKDGYKAMMNRWCARKLIEL